MLTGNLLAVPQRSVKRMLAYSSIAHAGYLLVAVAAMGAAAPRADATEGLLFYLASYAATVVGASFMLLSLEKVASFLKSLNTLIGGIAGHSSVF